MKSLNLLVVAASILFLECPVRAEVPPPAESAAWRKQMQEFYPLLSRIMTNASSEQRFNSPKRQAELKRDAKRLAEAAEAMGTRKVPSPDQDPMIAMVGMMFRQQTRQASEELARGNRSYARSLLQTVGNYCIACHTRNDSGPKFSELPLKPEAGVLSGSELADFYAASRQYDLALREYRAVIAAPPGGDITLRSRAARNALAILVRVKRDPAAAGELASQVAKSGDVPYFLRETAGKWVEAIRQWQVEGARTATTEEGLFAEANRLIAQARAMQVAPADDSADVLYLRASSVLHDQLSLAPQGPRAAAAMLMEGICYEVLRDMKIWDLHELYYQACIHQSPHSDTALACFKRYQESVYFGFTGSAGTSVPAEAKRRLTELEALAAPSRPVRRD